MENTGSRRFFTMAETHDRMCQLLVPQYDFLQDGMLRMLRFNANAEIAVVDLGAGSGIFLEKVLSRYPRARCYWVDYSQDFRQTAKRKLSRFDGRVEYLLTPIEAEWQRPLPKVDVVFSMSAIHHLTQEEKKGLYRRVFELLAPSGWFLNVDEMKTAFQDACLESMLFWVRHVADARERVTDEHLDYYEKWKAHFDDWRLRNVDNVGKPKAKGDDLHEDYANQLGWLREIGFTRVDLFIKYHLWCAIGGRKPSY